MHTKNKNNKHLFFAKQFLVLLFSIFLTVNLLAQAGTSIFTYGKVSLRSADGRLSELSKGMSFNTGDAILTGVNGRVQLRMEDGAIFDLKPNTEFIIEEFNFSNSNNASEDVKEEENKGFYRVMRGGFRTISGLIGKRNKKNYRVTTPVATIGIRGTDYTIDICEVNCSPVYGAGLYLTVGSGGVVLANEGGSLDVDAGFGGFVANPYTAPVATGAGNGNGDSDDDSLDSDNNVILEDPVALGRAAMSISGTVDQSTASGANIKLGASDDLTDFSSPTTTYSIGTATTSNQGSDATTGLSWGRWSGGTATAARASGTTDIDLEASSAHYIYNTRDITPTLPLGGIANFKLLGNTDPTDNMGNTGVLGPASLSADFTNQTVDAAVNLNINSLRWNATATDVPLDGNAASFAGDFDQVVISDVDGNSVNGSGNLEGFFSGDINGDISGAGMAYSLSDDADTRVDGVVAFAVEPSPVP